MNIKIKIIVILLFEYNIFLYRFLIMITTSIIKKDNLSFSFWCFDAESCRCVDLLSCWRPSSFDVIKIWVRWSWTFTHNFFAIWFRTCTHFCLIVHMVRRYLLQIWICPSSGLSSCGFFTPLSWFVLPFELPVFLLSLC